MRAGLTRLSENKNILIFDIHHIICDGVSVNILIKGFSKLYEGKILEDIRVQCKDFAIWQSKLYKSDLMKK
ncbi:condensation domain-containing protein [Clostridium sp. UBA6640]|uniref:condensation domain-containing protein n=1 Tax=Clostridium sp. UBA6640 TaxID=1946370 RepID=UPI0025BDF64B|nr:condensation domain-containing protein [Clostridium sp. UBA6640]